MHCLIFLGGVTVGICADRRRERKVVLKPDMTTFFQKLFEFPPCFIRYPALRLLLGGDELICVVATLLRIEYLNSCSVDFDVGLYWMRIRLDYALMEPGKADQNVDEPDNERVMLASLIANLKLDVDENKMKHKQLKKENTSLSQELEKSKQDLFYCRSELEKYKKFQTNHKDKEKVELECAKALGLLAKTK
ncbi:hypothetical protein Tco_0299792 [Tanacetum coccineum]